MEVDRYGADIPKPIPDCAADGQVNGLNLDGEAQAVEWVLLDYIKIDRSQPSGDELLTCTSPNGWKELLEVV